MRRSAVDGLTDATRRVEGVLILLQQGEALLISQNCTGREPICNDRIKSCMPRCLCADAAVLVADCMLRSAK